METFADSTLYLAIRKGAASVLPERYASYADDLAQDGWIKADRWRSRHQVEIEYPATLGYRIGRNLSLTFLKREKSRTRVEVEPPSLPPSNDMPDPMESMFSDSGKNAEDLQGLISIREALSGAYEQLSPRQTEIWLFLFQGHTQQHICEVLGLWPSQVSRDVAVIEKAIKALLDSYFDPTDPSHHPPAGVLLRRRGGSDSNGSHGGTMHRKTRTGKSSLMDTLIPQSLVGRMLRLILHLPGFTVPSCPAERDEMKDLAAILIELGVAPWLKPARQLAAKNADIERAVYAGGPLGHDFEASFWVFYPEASDQPRSLLSAAGEWFRAIFAIDFGTSATALRYERPGSWWFAEPAEAVERHDYQGFTVFALASLAGGTGAGASLPVFHFLGHGIRGGGVERLPQRAMDCDADLGCSSGPGDREAFDFWFDYYASIVDTLPVTCGDGVNNRNPFPSDGLIGISNVTDHGSFASGSDLAVRTNRKTEILLEIYGTRCGSHGDISYSLQPHEFGSWPCSTSFSCKLTFTGGSMAADHRSSDWGEESRTVAFKEEKKEALYNFNARALLCLYAWVAAGRKDFGNLSICDLDGYVLNDIDAEFKIVLDEDVVREEEFVN